MQIKYLREFGKLQTLVLKGTPVSLLDIYKSFTVAYIPSLIYLDFDYILEDEVANFLFVNSCYFYPLFFVL